MEEDIKILESYLDRNTQLFEDYGDTAIIQDKEIQALENLIKEYRKLEEELERQREINTIINKQNLDDNYERALEKTMTKFLNENIGNEFIPKSKVKEKMEELDRKIDFLNLQLTKCYEKRDKLGTETEIDKNEELIFTLENLKDEAWVERRVLQELLGDEK